MNPGGTKAAFAGATTNAADVKIRLTSFPKSEPFIFLALPAHVPAVEHMGNCVVAFKGKHTR
jgi:hypothetical protein